MLGRRIFRGYVNTTIPIRLIKMPTITRNHGTVLDPLLSPPATSGKHLEDRESIISTLSRISSSQLLEQMYVYRKGTEITTGWLILTWQLFAIELYGLSSQKIGVEQLHFSWATQAIYFSLALIVHTFILFLSIRLCQWFLQTFHHKWTEPETFSDVALPIFMAFFAVLDRCWHIACAIFILISPKVLVDMLNIDWWDKVIWSFFGVFLLVELYAIYLIFIIIFIKKIPLDTAEAMEMSNMEMSNQDQHRLSHTSHTSHASHKSSSAPSFVVTNNLTPREHFMLLHIYHAMLAYGTCTILIAVMQIVIDPKIFYQTSLCLYFAIYGDDWVCTCDDYDDEIEDCAVEWDCPQDTETLYDAYEAVAHVLIQTLGRSHRISLLWRIVCEILDALIARHKRYVSHLSQFNVYQPNMQMISLDNTHDPNDINNNTDANQNGNNEHKNDNNKHQEEFQTQDQMSKKRKSKKSMPVTNEDGDIVMNAVSNLARVSTVNNSYAMGNAHSSNKKKQQKKKNMIDSHYEYMRYDKQTPTFSDLNTDMLLGNDDFGNVDDPLQSLNNQIQNIPGLVELHSVLTTPAESYDTKFLAGSVRSPDGPIVAKHSNVSIIDERKIDLPDVDYDYDDYDDDKNKKEKGVRFSLKNNVVKNRSHIQTISSESETFTPYYGGNVGGYGIANVSIYTTMWRGIMLAAMGIAAFFATRSAYQYEVSKVIVHGVIITASLIYVVMLLEIIVNLHREHKEDYKSGRTKYCQFNLKPSQWMFVASSILSIIYQVIYVTNNEPS